MNDTDRQDRALNVLGVVTLVVTGVVLFVGVATIVELLSQGDTLDAQARSDALAGCRSEYAADLATAEANLSRTEARARDAIFAGLVEVAEGDDAGLGVAVADAPEIQADVVAARAVRDEADEVRREAISLSRQDPAAFLAECRDRFG